MKLLLHIMQETLELENHTLVMKMSSTAPVDFVGQEM